MVWFCSHVVDNFIAPDLQREVGDSRKSHDLLKSITEERASLRLGPRTPIQLPFSSDRQLRGGTPSPRPEVPAISLQKRAPGLDFRPMHFTDCWTGGERAWGPSGEMWSFVFSLEASDTQDAKCHVQSHMLAGNVEHFNKPP